MKICYITMQFPVPSETFLSSDVEALVKLGHHISVFGLRPKHSKFKFLIEERGHTNIDVENFSFMTLIFALKFCILHPIMSLTLIHWVLNVCLKSPIMLLKSFILMPSVFGHFYKVYNSKPDVVHLFWGHYPSMLGFLVKRFMPYSVVSQFLGAHDLVSNYPGSTALAYDADLIFTHSKSNVPILEKRGIDIDKIHVIYRGIKLDFPHIVNTNKFHSTDNLLFLTASRLIKEKGVDDVLRVFSKVTDSFPNAKLYIAGDGPYKSDLLKLSVNLGCSERVFFLGHIPQSELVKYMSDSHFFILMSRSLSERLPNVVKEAMYQQCVVITTRSVGIDELVDSGVSGYVVSNLDYLACTEHVMFCLLYPDVARSICVSARNVIKQHFDVDQSMRKYIVLWTASINDKGLL